eukprot:5533509-Prymnesium_polylepis.2
MRVVRPVPLPGRACPQRPLDPGQPEDRVGPWVGHHDTRNGALCSLAAVRSSPFRVLTLRSRT